MKNLVEKALKASAKMSEKVAVKSCGATSFYDSYQPKVPAAVRKLRESK